MAFNPLVAAVKVGVFPLVKKDGMPELARTLYDELRRKYTAFYDEGGAIGRRYRRQDEVGTPFGITVDGQTLEDRTVTVRERDTMAQERLNVDQLSTYLAERLGT